MIEARGAGHNAVGEVFAVDAEALASPGPHHDGVEASAGRFACLDRCLAALPRESRTLIIEHYRDDRRDRISTRRALAARLRINGEALANRARVPRRPRRHRDGGPGNRAPN